MWELGKARAFKVHQLISNTWIGETGRGYLQHGIWMDNDLSKFFRNSSSPMAVRLSILSTILQVQDHLRRVRSHQDQEKRKRMLPLLHKAIGFLTPEMGKIQQSLKQESGSFSDAIPEFRRASRQGTRPRGRTYLREYPSSHISMREK